MGRLIDGEWYTDEVLQRLGDEVLDAEPDSFRDWIDPADVRPGRYHLYVSRACPWAHRTALVRRLKGLEGVVSMDVVDPVRNDQGWEFSPEKDGCTPDTRAGADYLREVYVGTDSSYTGRVTVPVLYDGETGTIVNEESADVARMLDRAFDGYATRSVELYPDEYREDIDEVVEEVHAEVNRGVYRAGFADTQTRYERAVEDLFESLERWDRVLGERRFLVGDRLTLADVFLFPTLFRFDAVYHTHFKCNVRRLVDFTDLWGYARELYQLPGVARTCDLEHVKAHYYRSHRDVNPTGLVPVGPEVDWTAPHDRERLGGSLPDSLRAERAEASQP